MSATATTGIAVSIAPVVLVGIGVGALIRALVGYGLVRGDVPYNPSRNVLLSRNNVP